MAVTTVRSMSNTTLGKLKLTMATITAIYPAIKKMSWPVTGAFPRPSITDTLVMIVDSVWLYFGSAKAEFRFAHAKITTPNEAVIVFKNDISHTL